VKRGRAPAVVTAVAAAFLLGFVAPGAAARADDGDAAAQKAAKEIQAAKDRADAAAAAYAKAEFELENLEDQSQQLSQQQTQLQGEVEALQTQVEQVAVNRFVNSGTGGIPLLTGYRGPSEQLQADVLANVATESSADTMDEYDQARKQLDAKQHEVAASQADLTSKQEQFKQLQQAAEAEAAHLQQVEQKRLEDERIRKAIEAQQREEQRKRDEEAKRQAEAAAAAAAAQQAAEAQRAAESAAALAAAAPAQTAGDPAPVAALAAPAAPAPDGGDSAAAAPEPRPASSSGLVCPVHGSAYTDTWGAARSGGRRHLGVDMLAPRGTPIYAVVAGRVDYRHNPLGGNAASIDGVDGNHYYFAHMSAYEGSDREVQQGEVIGYVGDTGDARGTNHLHFEVHPGGGAAVNPYPYVRNLGC
jgi:murein DD-endopeptidase MepM/ murein hydrolase activator NlpD